jgi:diguanylate cyclase (GGDEF)-like protein
MNEHSQKQKILIVGDVSPNMNELVEALKSSDYEIVVATTGESALEIAHSIHPDLIFLDVVTSELDGYAIGNQLKEKEITEKIPVICIASQDDDETKGLQFGAMDYVTKPFHFPLIKARAKNYLTLKRQKDILEHLSTVDSLTGISNRRRFDVFLEHEWRRAIRGISNLSLIMMDIDYFKQFNEHYGYVAGDECLKQVATILDSTIERSTDLMARYDSDKFVCILPLTNAKGATVLANKLKEIILSLKIPHVQSAIAEYITISLGIATRRPYPNSSPSLLISDAETALHEAKRYGGNQIKNID